MAVPPPPPPLQLTAEERAREERRRTQGRAQVLADKDRRKRDDPSDILTQQFNSMYLQKFLPFGFQTSQFDPRRGGYQTTDFGIGLERAGRNLSQFLAQAPGSLSPSLAPAISARLASEQEMGARNIRNLQQEAGGNIARSNLGNTPFAAALQTAIEQAGARTQAEGRREALMQSEQLKRADMQTIFQTLDTLFKFVESGRSAEAAKAGLTFQGQQQQQTQNAAYLAAIGSLLGNPALFSGGGGKK